MEPSQGSHHHPLSVPMGKSQWWFSPCWISMESRISRPFREQSQHPTSILFFLIKALQSSNSLLFCCLVVDI